MVSSTIFIISKMACTADEGFFVKLKYVAIS